MSAFLARLDWEQNETYFEAMRNHVVRKVKRPKITSQSNIELAIVQLRALEYSEKEIREFKSECQVNDFDLVCKKYFERIGK